MNCIGCGLPIVGPPGKNVHGKEVDYHPYQSACVDGLRAELAKKDLQVSEARNEAMLLHCDNQDLRKEVERLKKFLPHDGKPCYGPGCHHCDEDEEAKTEKRKDDWAICGWCAGSGKEDGPGGARCPKCDGVGGFIRART